VDDLMRGLVVAVVDDIDGTGCDIVALASEATAASVAELVRSGSGFVCVTVDAQTCHRLDLGPITWDADSDSTYTGLMRVSVDARVGTGTGISARDRATTLRVLADPHSGPDAVTRPGHVIPVLPDPTATPFSRPAVLARLAELCGSATASVAYCAAVSRHDPMRMADATEVVGWGIPVLRYSEIVAAP
jgi:3,4-dihydroxy-2-butanone 4-phosphate synthase